MALHLNYLAEATALAWAIVTSNWVVVGAASIAILITLFTRTLIGRRALRDFGEDFAAIKIIPYEVALVWYRMSYTIRHRLANKLDFTTHKQ